MVILDRYRIHWYAKPIHWNQNQKSWIGAVLKITLNYLCVWRKTKMPCLTQYHSKPKSPSGLNRKKLYWKKQTLQVNLMALWACPYTFTILTKTAPFSMSGTAIGMKPWNRQISVSDLLYLDQIRNATIPHSSRAVVEANLNIILHTSNTVFMYI